MDDALRQKLISVPDDSWWIVRGDTGRLWESLFVPRGVVAHAAGITPFSIDCDYETRQRMMLGFDNYDRSEVNIFLDNLDDAGVIVPSDGSREAGFGIVQGEAFASIEEGEKYWQRRPCCWHPKMLKLSDSLARHMQNLGPRGTIFTVPKNFVLSIRELVLATK